MIPGFKVRQLPFGKAFIICLTFYAFTPEPLCALRSLDYSVNLTVRMLCPKPRG